MNRNAAIVGPLTIFVACGTVAVLSWQGKFTSMMGFPKVFAVVCLVVGLASLRKQPQAALAARVILVLAGSALAYVGGMAQDRFIRQRNDETQSTVMAALGGKPAVALSGIKPLNVDVATLSQASSFSSKATIINFWSRRCSPCLRELPELNEFYQEHERSGLAVVAITSFDEDLSDDERAVELRKSKRLVTQLGLRFPVAVASTDDLSRSYMVYALPSTALVDVTGQVVAYGVGDAGGREVMKQALALLRD